MQDVETERILLTMQLLCQMLSDYIEWWMLHQFSPSSALSFL